MGETKGNMLQYVMKISWESEQMPGWEDSLSMILETTKKEFQMKSKDTTQKIIEADSVELDTSVLEEFSM